MPSGEYALSMFTLNVAGMPGTHRLRLQDTLVADDTGQWIGLQTEDLAITISL